MCRQRLPARLLLLLRAVNQRGPHDSVFPEACYSPAAVKVIFHADDFGLAPAVNAGIVEAHQRGLLRSTSLMVSADAAEDAAALARSLPDLDVGLHVTLVEERPVLPPDRIPSLVTEGRFWPSHGAVFARYATGRWNVAEAAAEVAAQWDRLAA